MKHLGTVMLVGALTLVSLQAEAARMGGGRSIGRQSPNVTQRQATPPTAPAAAPTQNANAARPGQATPPAAAAPRRPWGAMLGGIAAGLGLAWLAHSLGMGAGFGNLLTILLFVMLGVVVWRLIAARNRGASTNRGRFAFEGATDPAHAPEPMAYNPRNVGNDASARPFERQALDVEPTAARGGSSMAGASSAHGGSLIGSALSGSQSWGVPAGFDEQGFLTAAKRNFVTLQGAWDRADMSTLRAMMTDDMVGEIRQQLAERESHTGGSSNQTEVVMLEAKLLGIEEMPDGYMASVEFSGMIREDQSSGPSPFREVWNMTRPLDGSSGWLVAGVQALQ